MLITKQQITSTLNLLMKKHQQIVTDFSTNKLIPTNLDDVTIIFNAMNALWTYQQILDRVQKG